MITPFSMSLPARLLAISNLFSFFRWKISPFSKFGNQKLGFLYVMGCFFSSFSSADENSEGSVPVLLNVYDLTPLNNYSYCCGLGIFHSGIEVHGSEYGFGAHEFPSSGVFEVEPRSCPGFVYRCSVTLGHVHISPYEARAFVENMAAEYHGDAYHLIYKNCNHFTDDACHRLTGNSIPGWVNRLARLGAACSCLLPECLNLPTVKQIPEYHGISEEGSESAAFYQNVSVITSQELTESDDADQEKRHLLSLSESSSEKDTHR